MRSGKWCAVWKGDPRRFYVAPLERTSFYPWGSLNPQTSPTVELENHKNISKDCWNQAHQKHKFLCSITVQNITLTSFTFFLDWKVVLCHFCAKSFSLFNTRNYHTDYECIRVHIFTTEECLFCRNQSMMYLQWSSPFFDHITNMKEIDCSWWVT